MRTKLPNYQKIIRGAKEGKYLFELRHSHGLYSRFSFDLFIIDSSEECYISLDIEDGIGPKGNEHYDPQLFRIPFEIGTIKFLTLLSKYKVSFETSFIIRITDYWEHSVDSKPAANQRAMYEALAILFLEKNGIEEGRYFCSRFLEQP